MRNSLDEPMVNALKRDLAQGKPRVGTVLTVGSPVVAEVLSRIGYDWLWFDLEHTCMSLETLQVMLQATNGTDVSNIVRVPLTDEVWVKRTLDIGPHGLIFPLVNSKEDAEAAVRFMKYQPRGVRGAGLGRAQGYGEGYAAGYFANADAEVMTIVQIEHIDAVHNIESILGVEGVDAVFLGPLDLSGSMGLLGKTDHPDVEAAIQEVLRAARKANVPAGVMAMSPGQTSQRIREGFTLMGMGFDVDFLIDAASAALKQIER